MAGTSKRIRELRRFLESDGHTVQSVEQTGGCHLRLKVNGHTYTAALSPTCKRSLLNLRADIRRDARCAS